MSPVDQTKNTRTEFGQGWRKLVEIGMTCKPTEIGASAASGAHILR
jgi:hypothetical protein